MLKRQRELPGQYPSQKALDDHIALMQPGGEAITSPVHIAIVEQIRQEALTTIALSAGVPTGVFVFCRGEPRRRDITKVAGLPYWPANEPWPLSEAGRPLTFLAQFNFADSRKIVGELPGDVLLIFADGGPDDVMPDYIREFYAEQGGLDEGNWSSLFFKWLDLGHEDLIAEEAIPKTSWRSSPCYGAIHQTFDYPGQEDAFDNYNRSYQLPVIEGTKIGRVPRWIQDEEDLPGRFLCALGSVHPSRDEPYPFLNDPTPCTWEEEFLTWGDVGSVYIFLDRRGTIHWTMQCY